VKAFFLQAAEVTAKGLRNRPRDRFEALHCALAFCL
jgi:hypothetical protein